MKNIFLLLFVVSNFLNAQTIDKEIQFSIECYKDDIEKNKSLKFVLNITNNTNGKLIIPSEFLVDPKNSRGCDIDYEIYYCTSVDTIDVLTGISHVDGFNSWDEQDLDAGMSHLFSTSIYYTPSYFQQKGVYRIRFVLRSNSRNKFITKDIFTQWIFVTVS